MSNPITINELNKQLPNKVDLFICSASFEDRCEIFPNQIFEQLSIERSIVFYISDLYQAIIDNSIKLQDSLGGEKFARRVELDTKTPFKNAIAVTESINEYVKIENLNNVVVDTSTFTHENLLILLRILIFKKSQIKNLYLGYVGAEDYDIHQPNPDLKWLSSGISAIRSIVGYPGVISPARNNHLIVMFGFESSRTQILIDHSEFNELSLGFGPEDDSITNEHYWINRNRHEKLLNRYSHAHSFTFGLTDPWQAQKDIEKQIAKFPDHNVVIVAMNNKISTIGAGLTAIENSRIQIIYAKPIEYNTRGYAKPKHEAFIHKLL
nr:hypothetical protein [uncultured Allomuricauda sp.]